jgi:hypothetical protein
MMKMYSLNHLSQRRFPDNHTAGHDRLIGFMLDTVNQNEFLSQPAQSGPQQSVASTSGSFNCFFIRLAQMIL